MASTTPHLTQEQQEPEQVTSHNTTQSRQRFAPRKLLWVGPLTIAVALLANLGIRAVAVAAFGVADGFSLLRPPMVITTTVIFVTLAVVAFLLVGRIASRPVHAYRIVALVALLVSLLNPIMALVGLFPAPGMNLPIFVTMIVLHTVTAIIAVGFLTGLAVER